MNIKNILSLTLLLATPAVIAADLKPVAATKAEVKTGYFNSAQVVSESALGKEAYADIEKKRLGFEEAFKKKEAAYTKKIKDLQAKASTMSDAAKRKAEEELMKDKREIENEAKGYDEDLKLAMNQEQDKIAKDLNDAVYKTGRAEGNDVMVDVASGRVYLINPDKVNSSSTIVKHMDAAYKKAAQPKKPATTK